MEDKSTAIEEIAWQLFLNKSGISFIRELTPKERKSVTDEESFEYYRKEAVKLYEKKQRALTNKKYPVIEVAASGKRGMYGGAYCLCFVYSKYDGNFVLKGYWKEVEEHLKKNYTHYFYNLSLWHRGLQRNLWNFWKDDIGVFEPDRRSKHTKGKSKWKFEVRPYSSFKHVEKGYEEFEPLWFKRMPHRWIPEFDKF